VDALFIQIVVITLLIVINGFFSCSEFAIISVRKSRIAQLVSEGNERARLVEELQRDPHRLLAMVQVGVTVVASLASAMGGIIAVEHIKPFLLRSTIEFFHNGAEAISINGVRLQADTAIHCAGPAIYVRDISLTPPFIIAAIGDSTALSDAILHGGDAGNPAAIYQELQVFGIVFTVEKQEGIMIPASETTDAARRASHAR